MFFRLLQIFDFRFANRIHERSSWRYSKICGSFHASKMLANAAMTLPFFAGMIIRRAAAGVAVTFSEAAQISRGFTNQLYRALNERAEVRDENFRFVATETPRGSFDVSRLDAQFLALPVAQAARIQRIKVPPVSSPVFVQAGNLEVRTINTQTSSLSLRILLAREFHPRETTWLVLALIRQKKKK